MSLQTRLSGLITAVGADIKALTALAPSSDQKAALLTRNINSGPGWNYLGLGQDPPPKDNNRYLSEYDRAVIWFDIASAGFIDVWPGDGYWLCKAFFGFGYDDPMVGVATVAAAKWTNGTTRRISIRDQWAAGAIASATWSVVNQDTTTAMLRCTATHGNTRVAMWDSRGQHT